MNKYRTFNTNLEITNTQALENGDAVFEGYFIKYNTPAPCEPFSYYEMISQQALDNTLDNDIRCLFNHNTDLVLGRTSNNTLILENRPDGLFGRCILNLNDTEARNAYERVKRGDITGCSFGAYIKEETYDEEKNIFIIEELDLREVSVCSFPFYESTTMQARDKFLNKKRLKELNLKYLRKQGERRWR